MIKVVPPFGMAFGLLIGYLTYGPSLGYLFLGGFIGGLVGTFVYPILTKL